MQSGNRDFPNVAENTPVCWKSEFGNSELNRAFNWTMAFNKMRGPPTPPFSFPQLLQCTKDHKRQLSYLRYVNLCLVA